MKREPITMSQQDSIVQFVRGTLGCGCEDAVFRRIELAQAAAPQAARDLSLDIGGRLLIRILAPVSAADCAGGVAAWLEQGRAQRDAAGFNRFRLVLGTAEVEAVAACSGEALRAAGGEAARLHVHVLPLPALPDFAR